MFRVVFTDDAGAEITQHPQSRTVAVGQPATFTVAASGRRPLSFQWQRNGVNIAGATVVQLHARLRPPPATTAPPSGRW